MRAKIRAELAKIKSGSTQCPGKLSRAVGSTLRKLRPTLEAMARAGEVRFYQKGRRVSPEAVRGPFRISSETDTFRA
jgi:predicted transcriptional regulator